MRAFVLRHGDTFTAGEPARRIGVRTDIALVSGGRAQARALAAHFANIRFDRVLTSPLTRTRETAAIVAPDMIAETTPWLAEIDHGPDEGQVEEAVLARIGPTALIAWEDNAVPPPGWIVDADMRTAAWRRFFTEARGTILLVTSNGAARFARIALGYAPAKLRTGAYGEIADGRISAWDIRP